MERKSEFWASQNVVITNCNQARDDERLGDVVIQSKEDYLRFLENDKKALYKKENHPSIIDYIWKYERLLRKTEYYVNCRRDLVGRVWGLLLKYRLNRFGLRLGYTIPINVCDEGLSLVHYGNVTINLASRIGKNCRIYNGVVIGSQGFGGGVLRSEITL